MPVDTYKDVSKTITRDNTGKSTFWDVIGWRAEMPTDSTVQTKSDFNKTLLIVGIVVIAGVLMGTFFIAYKK